MLEKIFHTTMKIGAFDDAPNPTVWNSDVGLTPTAFLFFYFDVPPQ